MTGVQSIVRLLLEQSRLDRTEGHRTAGFVTGYRGSPLGGLDLELGRAQDHLQEAAIEFQPAINEDLAATAIWGSQQVGLFEGSRFDGVFGLWYGKSPGLDRSTDAIRHANMAGTTPLGGALAIVGDDPDCKSSTLPSDSTGLLRDLNLPILDPSDVKEVIEYGLYGWALSRHSGCWVSMVAQTSVMDSSATVHIPSNRAPFVSPALDFDPHIRLSDTPHEQERRLALRLDAVLEFGQANPINRALGTEGECRLTILTTGKSYTNVRQSLHLLGLSTQEQIAHAGIRVLKLGLIWPVDKRWLAKHVLGSKAVLVVESKGAFLETELRSTLYGSAHVPIIGKHDLEGRPLLSSFGELQIDAILAALVQLSKPLGLSYPTTDVSRGLVGRDAANLEPMNLNRKPLFCPGCPHAHSTKVPDGSRAFAGIGCHYMAQWMHRETYLFTHMGGEGANWIGQAPFTDTSHVFVNLGDGTYSHSGLLAVRAAVAAKVNVTYKILFNDAVAMTGGQAVDGELTVADVVAQVRAIGVSDVRVIADDPNLHRGAPYPVAERSQLQRVQRELREVEGCSVLIVDHACANEKRRKQKRNILPPPSKFVMINEVVCEGCGDCVVQSGCSAISTVNTEFGVKRQIDQAHCIQDLACIEGYCPALVEIHGSKKVALTQPREPDIRLHEPDVPKDANILITGVGGTGVVTLSQVIAVAAHIEGKHVCSLDMTGLAQKGGAVISHLRVAEDHVWRTRLSRGETDVLLAADSVTAQSLEIAPLLSTSRTHAIVNHLLMPSYRSVIDHGTDYQLSDMLLNLQDWVAHMDSVDAAKCAHDVSASNTVANTVLLGYAYQLGLIPLSRASLRRAIELNGVAVPANLAAFEAGRLETRKQEKTDSLLPQHDTLSDLEKFVQKRVNWLAEYQNERLAQAFESRVRQVQQIDYRISADEMRLTQVVADALFRTIAVKDEYEVARLLTKESFVAQVANEFDNPVIHYAFAPTWLRSDGERGKVKIGPWITPLLKALSRMRILRGKWLDPFRFSEERKFDRWLHAKFCEELDQLLTKVNSNNYETVVAIVETYRDVKGYGRIRKDSWVENSKRLDDLWHELDSIGQNTDNRVHSLENPISRL